MQSKYEQFLIKDGLPGQAFMLHPFKLTWAEKDLQGAFWSWWTSGSCLEHSGRDGSWQVGFTSGDFTLKQKHKKSACNVFHSLMRCHPTPCSKKPHVLFFSSP